MNPTYYLFTYLVLSLLLLFNACEQESLQSPHDSVQTEQELQEILSKSPMNEFQDIPEYEVELPQYHHEPTISALTDSVDASDGNVHIGLKAPDSKRLYDSGGIREALSAGEFRAGVEFLLVEGIEVYEIYSFGGVRAKIDSKIVKELLGNKRIDFIEARKLPEYFTL